MEVLLPGLDSAPNVHPMFVHFPIALWLTALLFWTLASLRGRDELWKVGRWLLYLGSLGSVAAVGTGLWAAEQLGHDSPGHDLVHVHRNWMLLASGLGLAAAAAAFAARRRATPAVRWLLFAALTLTGIVLVLGADRGALLVHRYGIGTVGEVPPGSYAREHEGPAGSRPAGSVPGHHDGDRDDEDEH